MSNLTAYRERETVQQFLAQQLALADMVGYESYETLAAGLIDSLASIGATFPEHAGWHIHADPEHPVARAVARGDYDTADMLAEHLPVRDCE